MHHEPIYEFTLHTNCIRFCSPVSFSSSKPIYQLPHRGNDLAEKLAVEVSLISQDDMENEETKGFELETNTATPKTTETKKKQSHQDSDRLYQNYSAYLGVTILCDVMISAYCDKKKQWLDTTRICVQNGDGFSDRSHRTGYRNNHLQLLAQTDPEEEMIIN